MKKEKVLFEAEKKEYKNNFEHLSAYLLITILIGALLTFFSTLVWVYMPSWVMFPYSLLISGVIVYALKRSKD